MFEVSLLAFVKVIGILGSCPKAFENDCRF
jgi:hypothetical protein